MMFDIAFMLAMQVSQPAADYTIHKEISIEYIPSDIAPAIMPYGDCVGDRVNAEAGDGLGSGKAVLAAQSRAVEYCKAERVIAREKALKLLASEGVPSSTQIAQVDDALTNIEHQMDAVAERVDSVNSLVKKK